MLDLVVVVGWTMADIVIRGGRVCDGNGGASFIGDGALLQGVWEQLLPFVWEQLL